MAFWQRIVNVFRPDRLDGELREELEFHLAERQAELERQGLSPQAARAAARRQFGNVLAQTEKTREMNMQVWLEGLWQDVRHSGRLLRRSPGFTAVAVLSLGLGIGLTSALFSVVDAVLLKPLPLPEQEQLVWLRESRRGEGRGGGPARLKDFSAQTKTLTAITGFYSEGVTLQGPDGPQRVNALRTFGRVGDALGIKPVLGRPFSRVEEMGQGQAVALISHRLWSERFGRSEGVLGQTIGFGKAAAQIIGVLPTAWDYPENADLWIPAPAYFQDLDRTSTFLGIVGRMKPGIALETAQAELNAISDALANQYPATDQDLKVELLPLQAFLTRDARTPLLALFGAMSAVLLVACVNVAGLLLARGWARQREAGIRVALGAGTGRLVRLQLLESLWLAALGCGLGLLVALQGVAVLKAILPAELPRLAEVALDGRVVLFSLAVASVCALLAGVMPALQEVRGSLVTRLKEGGAGSVGRGKQRLRAALVVAEVALSMVLLVGAGLLAHSLVRLQQVPLGFRPEQVLTMGTAFAWDSQGEEIRRVSLGMVERMKSLPGVQAAGVVDRLPFAGGAQSSPAAIRGAVLTPDQAQVPVGFRTASRGYFEALHVPLVAGTLYPERPREQGPVPVVVNARFAQVFFAGRSPVGQRVKSHPKAGPVDDKDWLEVVGVIGNVRQDAKQREIMPEVYRPWGAEYWPLMSFAARVQGDPLAQAAVFRKVFAEVAPNQPLQDVQTMVTAVEQSGSSARVQTGLLGGFALFALLLAAIGLYGLLAGEVTRRTQEFGVRLALGAEPAHLLGSAFGRGLRLVLAGLVLGAVGALSLGRLLRSLLFEVEPTDLWALGGAGLVLLLVAALACWLPARRAARVDPLIALRHE